MNKLRYLILLLLCVFIPLSCGITPKNSISVVTFNMYVGFDVEARFSEFESNPDINATALAIFTDFQASDPEERIKAAAFELAALSPDFIGLQEVTLFLAAPVFSFDYLSLLVEEIENAGGPAYKYIATENIVLEETVDTGAIPIAVYFSDSEALLYKSDFKIEGDIVNEKLSSYREPITFEGREIIFYRSLLGARFTYGGENLASVFTTHLDQEYLGDIQRNQMSEIIDILKDYSEDDNLVLIGDFNSEEGEVTYELAPDDGYIDTYRIVNDDEGLTCCNLSDLSNETAAPYQKIDLIFHKSSKWQVKRSEVILNKKDPIWPSDHFGLLTIFERAEGNQF